MQLGASLFTSGQLFVYQRISIWYYYFFLTYINKKFTTYTHMLLSNNLGSSLRLSYFRDASVVFLESIQGCKVHTQLMRKKFSLDPPLPLHECREETPFIHLCPRFHSKSRLTLVEKAFWKTYLCLFYERNIQKKDILATLQKFYKIVVKREILSDAVLYHLDSLIPID